MPLPKIDLPIFELKIVSVKNPIRFRPFLMKEEKLLLMALQSGDDDSIYASIKQVINNCILDDIDIDKIPIFDIEYLFLNIRARSIGEKLETFFICKNIVGESENEDGEKVPEECTTMMPLKINILDIKPPIYDMPDKIHLTKTVGMKLNYPTMKNFKPIEDMIANDDVKLIFESLYTWLDYIFDENGLYYKKEMSKDEFFDFLQSLTQEQFDKLINFFDTLPKIGYDTELTCQKCGHNHEIRMEGLNDFFI
jgi:T4 bacteriophage base plate protein